MENGDNLQGLVSVGKQSGTSRPTKFTGSSVDPCANGRRRVFRKINDLRADDGFNPVGHLKTGVFFDVAQI
jgi:hypothetical protein